MAKSEIALRPLEEKDASRMLEWLNDTEVTKYLNIKGGISKLEDSLSFIRTAKKEDFNLHRAIVGKDDVYLGTISLKNIDSKKQEAEYAIVMHPAAQGTGAAFAASELIIDYAFSTMGLSRIYLYVEERNERALKLYYKLGFIYTHSTSAKVEDKDFKYLWLEISKSNY